MRDHTLGQPAGGPFLSELLGYAQHKLIDTKFNGLYYYKMGMGHVDQYADKKFSGVNKTDLHKPSYNLVVYYNEIPILVAYYELDRRFSMEMSEEEAERVEDYLANEVIGLLGSYGVLWFVGHRMKNRMLSITKKESDDKKFLSLN